MTKDNVPETNNIRNTWILARSMGGEVAPVTPAEAAVEFDQWFFALMDRTAELERKRLRFLTESSFDHAYDENIDPRNPNFDHAEGYRHRDRQVRTVLEDPK